MIDGQKKRCILFIGTYPPRECGIATFTKDLTEAISSKCKNQIDIKICAMTKNEDEHEYPEEVIYQIEDSNMLEYFQTANPDILLNLNTNGGYRDQEFWEELVASSDSNNLRDRTLEEIIHGDLFTKIAQTWYHDPLKTCANNCSRRFTKHRTEKVVHEYKS